MNRAVLSDLEQQDKLRSFNSEHRPLRRKYKQSKCHNRKYPRRQNLAPIILRKLVHKFNQNRTTRNLQQRLKPEEHLLYFLPQLAVLPGPMLNKLPRHKHSPLGISLEVSRTCNQYYRGRVGLFRHLLRPLQLLLLKTVLNKMCWCLEWRRPWTEIHRLLDRPGTPRAMQVWVTKQRQAPQLLLCRKPHLWSLHSVSLVKKVWTLARLMVSSKKLSIETLIRSRLEEGAQVAQHMVVNSVLNFHWASKRRSSSHNLKMKIRPLP